MELIDEQGNLFGIVNVIDVLLIVLAISVVVAGVSVIGQGSNESSSNNRYVTIAIADQPAYVAQHVSPGDTVERDGQQLTITDVYLGPGGNGSVALTVAATVEGSSSGDGASITFAGDSIRPGRSLNVRTDEYRVEGNITAVADQSVPLNVSNRTVTIDTTVRSEVARHVERGDTYEIAGRDVGTIDSVRVFPTGDGDRKRVHAEIDVRTLQDGNDVRFGEHPVKIGSALPFSTSEYDITGTVIDRGAPDNSGSKETISAVVKIENVDPQVSKALEVGAEERTRGETYARIVDKRVEPAVITVSDSEGNVYTRDHPREENIRLTVKMSVRRTDGGLLFRGEQLQRGTNVRYDFGTISVDGTIVELNGG